MYGKISSTLNRSFNVNQFAVNTVLSVTIKNVSPTSYGETGLHNLHVTQKALSSLSLGVAMSKSIR